MLTIPHIDPRHAHQRHLTCQHCGSEPDFALGVDATRFVCTICTTKAIRKDGRSLHFPRDEQDELFLTTAPHCA